MLKSFYTQDFRVSYTIKKKLFNEWNIIAQANNIFDKKYEPSGYTFSYIYGGAFTTENFFYPMAGTNFMLAFNVELHEVVINDLQEGIFYSQLICSGANDTVEIDSRTSDALALAVRFGCPIYTYDTILDQAGVLMEDDGIKKKESNVTSITTEQGGSDDLKAMSLEELNTLLNNVLEQEDYIKAIAIRDEIKSRGK